MSIHSVTTKNLIIIEIAKVPGLPVKLPGIGTTIKVWDSGKFHSLAFSSSKIQFTKEQATRLMIRLEEIFGIQCRIVEVTNEKVRIANVDLKF